jgi:hypothetical protein
VGSRKRVLESGFSKGVLFEESSQSEFSKSGSRKRILESGFLKVSKGVLESEFLKAGSRKRALESRFSKARSLRRDFSK